MEGEYLKMLRQIIEQMSDNELVSLAITTKIPLTSRTMSRRLLIEKICENVSEFEDRKPSKERLNDPAVQIEGLHKTFGKKVAVKKLDLTVSPGEILGLVGPNGAGKTTTLRCMTGIISPTEGSVKVNGLDMSEEPIPAKKMIGYIPERPTCYPSLRVREYLTFMARIYGVSKIDAIVRTREYVELFQLDELINTYIGTLSKGNLQRTLLAGIFIRDPPYILAFDEPIYGLDPRGAWSLKAHLRKLRDEGSAILISTHILEVAEGLCDRFVIMNHGNVVGKGTLDELLSQFDGISSLEEVFLMLTGGIPEK